MKKIILLTTTIISLILSTSFTKTNDWYKLESKEFGFRVEFPNEPAPRKQQIENEYGIVTLNMFMYDATKTRKKDDNLVYALNYTEYPDSLVNADKMSKEELNGFYSKTINGTTENVHGKLLLEKVVILNGHSGRQVRIDFKDGLAVITFRMFLIKNKMYLLETITDTKNDFNLSINRFFDSFELLN